MGIVYAAYDELLDRKVAVKVVREGGAREETRLRVLREARALAKLSHPNVVQVYEADQWGEDVYIAMELIEGCTLDEWTQGRTWREVLAVYRQAGEGLAAAHGAGIVHRDFKPKNCLVGEDGRVRVLDFGLARPTQMGGRHAAVEAKAPLSSDSHADLHGPTLAPTPLFPDWTGSGRPRRPPPTAPEDTDATLTRTGAIMGTPAYMAPEQHLGEIADARADQFSFCVALYEAVYGERPFAGDNHLSLQFNVVQGSLREAPRDTKVPSWLRTALVRGLEVEPDGRHPDMATLLVQLDRNPERTRRRVLATAALVLASLGAGVGISSADPGEVAADPFCPNAEDGYRAIFGSKQRESLDETLATVKSDWEGEVAQRVETKLDAYARRWGQARATSCEATRVRGVQSDHMLDLQMACLDRRRRAFGAVLGTWREGSALDEAAQLTAAVRAIDQLPEVAACEDRERLLTATPLPDDALRSAAVQRGYATLAEVNAHITVNRLDAARNGLAEVRVAVEETGFEPLRAEWLEGQSRLADALGDYPKSADYAKQSYFTALAAGHDELASRASLLVLMAVGSRLRDNTQASQWLPHATAVVARQPKSSLDHAGLLYARARFGRSDGADQRLQNYVGAAELAAKHPRGRATYISILNEKAGFLAGRGEYELAAATRALVAELAQEDLGPRHPKALAMRLNLATVYMDSGDWDRARIELEAVHDGWKQSLPADHPNFIAVYNNLSACLLELGDFESAEALARKSSAQAQATWGQEHQSVSFALSALAKVLLAREQASEALELDRRAVAIWEAHGSYEGGILPLLVQLGHAQLAAGDPSEATKTYRRALELRRKIEGPDDWRAGYALLGLAESSLNREPAAARQHAESTLRHFERGKPLSTELAHARLVAAEAWATSDPVRARAWIDQARLVLDESGPRHQPLSRRAARLSKALTPAP
jgi:tetratricopeptide (TPR) repeat protein/predicted Ser/Thr protein kinase